MTKQEWFRAFRASVRKLPKAEQERVLDYYEELYLDKRELGIPEGDVLAEFGDPSSAASRILAEEAAPAAPAYAPPGYGGPVYPAPGRYAGSDAPPQNDYRAASYQTPPPAGYQAPPYQAPNPAGYQAPPNGFAGAPYPPPAGYQAPPYQAPPAPAGKPQVKRRFSGGRLAILLILGIPVGIVLFALVLAGIATALALVVAGIGVMIGGVGGTIATLVTNFVPEVWVAQAGVGLVALGLGILMTWGFAKLVPLLCKAMKGLFVGMHHFVFRRVQA